MRSWIGGYSVAPTFNIASLYEGHLEMRLSSWPSYIIPNSRLIWGKKSTIYQFEWNKVCNVKEDQNHLKMRVENKANWESSGEINQIYNVNKVWEGILFAARSNLGICYELSHLCIVFAKSAWFNFTLPQTHVPDWQLKLSGKPLCQTN